MPSSPILQAWANTVGPSSNSDLNQSAKIYRARLFSMDWKPVAAAPFDRDLQLAVIDYDGTHALVFPCRRILDGWINADTKKRIDLRPTHWREWQRAT
jgi:hypothetical protein